MTTAVQPFTRILYQGVQWPPQSSHSPDTTIGSSMTTAVQQFSRYNIRVSNDHRSPAIHPIVQQGVQWPSQSSHCTRYNGDQFDPLTTADHPSEPIENNRVSNGHRIPAIHVDTTLGCPVTTAVQPFTRFGQHQGVQWPPQVQPYHAIHIPGFPMTTAVFLFSFFIF